MLKLELFGTDGVRGLVNTYPIEPVSLSKLGCAIGQYMINKQFKKCVIARDTRISCDMIEHAILSSLISKGINIKLLGVLPSAALSLFIEKFDADLGIMISASHNPYYDNGVKLFYKNGHKFLDYQQKEIEDFFFGKCEFSNNTSLGKVETIDNAQQIYISSINPFKSKLKVVCDCGNGAQSNIAPKILDAIFINNNPDGLNINEKCGATDVRELSKKVIEESSDIGFAFDGDADRLAVVDEKGEEIPGEYILAAFVENFDYKKIVLTKIINPSLKYFLNQKGVDFFICDVGDVKVKEKMSEINAPIGGEPSGHFILNDFAQTSDGLISAIQLLNILDGKKQKDPKFKASDFKKPFALKPEFKKNVKLQSDIYDDFDAQDFSETLQLKSDFLIRKSGTEKNLRIMLWDNDLNNLEESRKIVMKKLDEFLSERYKKVSNQ